MKDQDITWVQGQLQEILEDAEERQEKFIELVKVRYIIPFCERSGYKLISGMGTWCFDNPCKRQRRLDLEEPGIMPAWMVDLMQLPYMNGREGCIGDMMGVYTPSTYKEKP